MRALCYSGICREGPRFPDEAPLACAVVCSADGTACADGFVHFVNEFGETILSQQVRACARARPPPACQYRRHVVCCKTGAIFMLYAVGGSGDAARGSHVVGVCLLFGRLRPEICLPELGLASPSVVGHSG